MAVLSGSTLDKITTAASLAFSGVFAKDATRTEAKDLLAEASNEATNERVNALIGFAKAANGGDWLTDDIGAGIDRAIAQRNAKETSIVTFAAEIKRACHASVRAHVGAMFDLATVAWDAEGELDKKAVKPLRKAFSRKYHLVVGRMFEQAIAGRYFADTDALVSYAIECDPDLDYKKVAKRLKAIREQLASFAADFPVDGLIECNAFLNAITPEDLRASREAPATTTDAPKVVDPATVLSSALPEPAPGVVDMDGMLSMVEKDMAA